MISSLDANSISGVLTQALKKPKTINVKISRKDITEDLYRRPSKSPPIIEESFHNLIMAQN
jgi:hypothetical protein